MNFKRLIPNRYHALVSDSIVLAMSRLLTMLFNIALIKFMSVEQYGQYSYYDYISIACYSLSNLGLTSILIKELQSKESNKVVSSFFVVKFLSILLMVFSSHFYLYYNDGHLNMVIANAFYTFALCFVWDWYFIGVGHSKKIAYHYFTYFLTSAGVCSFLFFYYGNVSPENIRVVQFLSLVVSIIINLRAVFIKISFNKVDFILIKGLVPRGINMLISQTIQNGSLIFITNRIKEYYGFHYLGVFSLVMRFINVFLSFRNMIVAPLTKYIISHGVESYLDVRRKALLTSILFLLTIILSAFAIFYFNLIYDSELIKVALILSCIPIVVMATISDGVIINMYNKQYIYLRATLLSLIILFFLVYQLGNSFHGLVLSYVVFETFYLIANRLYINKFIIGVYK
ncbi:TPA: hypothetical protein KDY14_000198 [Vibrio parahaemolyticus]|nr:hypothetical protein [Vibrio parahaemolyticus]MDF5438484.1 hypothetical protein [Vibrio parahaemolyticus]MDG2884640.1 hypothetical protein [Vibrio parahaemolyticus]HBC3436992.1 hypothetical protein [Vibrio parahaemolyticus]HBC3471772.1 hypothetical protein [Vibrio parahaemolyticus]